MYPKKNDIVPLTVEGWAADGAGVGRLDGLAVFVPGSAPGDACEVRILKVEKSRAFGRLEKLIRPAETRTDPGCPVYGRCGGCAFRHVTYEEELRAKAARVSEALMRIGGIRAEPEPILPSPCQRYYRNKVILHVAELGGRMTAGFYRRHSHDVVPAEDCGLQPAVVPALAAAVCRWAGEQGIGPYDEGHGEGVLRYLFFRISPEGGVQLCIVAAERPAGLETLWERLRTLYPELKGLLLCENASPGNVVLNGRISVIGGEERLRFRLGKLLFEVSPRSFFQINTAQTERLYAQAAAYAGLTGNETVLDLYCGIGTIALTLAPMAARVIGVESVPESVEDAAKNAALNRMENAGFLCADASRATALLEKRGIVPDVAVVDPPRKGLSGETVEAILRLSPERLVYVSCDPATLARDLRRLIDGGFAFRRIRPVDMFPRTASVEAVALLERG